jgi:hypothetical protein
LEELNVLSRALLSTQYSGNLSQRNSEISILMIQKSQSEVNTSSTSHREFQNRKDKRENKGQRNKKQNKTLRQYEQ